MQGNACVCVDFSSLANRDVPVISEVFSVTSWDFGNSCLTLAKQIPYSERDWNLAYPYENSIERLVRIVMYKNTCMLCSLVDEKFSRLCSFLQSFYKVRDCSNIHRHEGTNAKLMVRGLIEGGGGLKAS